MVCRRTISRDGKEVFGGGDDLFGNNNKLINKKRKFRLWRGKEKKISFIFFMKQYLFFPK
jgi:hypothetical protein